MRDREKIAALIPAAGYSSRMGDFKPLIKLNGITVIENSIAGFIKAGIHNVRVITGHRSDEITPVLDRIGIRYIINKGFDSGMFSSIVAGLKEIVNDTDGFFLLPGDMPLVKPRTIEIILEEFKKSSAAVLYPAFRGERGHPPLIAGKCFEKILSADLSSNLRSVLSEFENESADVEVIDRSILMDIDTPEELAKAKEYMKRGDIPTLDECAALFTKYKADERVIRHGEMVSLVSCSIAGILNVSGHMSLDVELVKTAALLHDIARDRPRHAAEGAAILKTSGFPRVGEIISTHMNIDYDEKKSGVDEAAIVYLADKLVEEDKLITLHERFAGSAERYSGNTEAMHNIIKRRETAMLIKQQIEKTAGIQDLESFLKSAEYAHGILIPV